MILQFRISIQNFEYEQTESYKPSGNIDLFLFLCLYNSISFNVSGLSPKIQCRWPWICMMGRNCDAHLIFSEIINLTSKSSRWKSLQQAYFQIIMRHNLCPFSLGWKKNLLCCHFIVCPEVIIGDCLRHSCYLDF